MNAISLFSGIGGFDLAFERAGFTVLDQVEVDRDCQNILKRHFQGARIYNDVKEYHPERSADVVFGGFPCQDLSVAGQREGLAGKRSGLWFEFARVIDELEPRWAVVENVPGLLSSNRGRDFAVIIQWLAKRGYGVAWRVLDAQYFGLAQRRKRVFVVASFGNGCAAEVLFERESGRWNTPPSRKAGERVTGTLDRKSTGANRGSQTNETEFLIPNQCMTPWDSQSKRVYTTNATSPTLDAQSRGGHQGGPTPPVIAWHNKQQYGEIRMQGDTVNSLTKQWGTGGNNVPFVGVRRLTPMECERLQGFPDGWTDGQSDSARYRQLGNAVAVPVTEWIAGRIPR